MTTLNTAKSEKIVIQTGTGTIKGLSGVRGLEHD